MLKMLVKRISIITETLKENSVIPMKYFFLSRVPEHTEFSNLYFLLWPDDGSL
jgi:hypothetical protein